MPMTEPDIRVHLSLESAREVWQTFEQTGLCTVFQSYAWAETWAATIGQSQKARFAVVDVRADHGHPVLLLAFALTRRRGLRVLGFLDGGVADYTGPIWDAAFAAGLGPDGFRTLWQRILDRLPPVDAIIFDKMAGTVEGAANPLLWLACTRTPMSGHLAVLTSFAAFQAGRGAKTRNSFSRRRRLLAQAGGLAVGPCQEPELRRQAIAQLLDIKLAQYPGAILSQPPVQDFYQALAAREDGLVTLLALSLDGKSLALRYGLTFRDRHYGLVSGFVPGEFNKFAPASLLIESLIEMLCARGIRIFDCGIGDEPYKKEWTDTILPLYDHVSAPSLAGKMGVLWPRRLKARLRALPWLARGMRNWRYRTAGRPGPKPAAGG